MTNDSHLFKTQSGLGRLPLYEGKMIHQFDHQFDGPRFWVDEKKGRQAVLGHDDKSGSQKLDYQKYRVGFRSAGENTNVRNFISAIIPKNSFCGNSIILSAENLNDDPRTLLFLCAMFNSFVLDYAIRLKISRNMNMFYIYQLPVPRVSDKDQVFAQIADRAAKLICTTKQFDELARNVGLGTYKDSVTDAAGRAKLRAEMDGIIAHLYGLTEDEFNHILATFPTVEQNVKEGALEAYKALVPKPGDQEVAAIIAKEESAELEFKSSARWDIRQNNINKEMEQVVVKTVAAFLNSEPGGTLLIGVEDGGTVLGLEHDFKTLGKRQNPDGYENFLTTLLLGNYGKDTSPLIQITFHQVDGKDVCRIVAKPSPKPVFVKDERGEHLFIRAGNSTRLLSTKEAIDYCKIRWKS